MKANPIYIFTIINDLLPVFYFINDDLPANSKGQQTFDEIVKGCVPMEMN
tara:strand:+ start:444 stop:593 length:150 start_codon:yes stop_codon:yes gene_type:complete